ncbi:hypothetical protein HanOQP8_Chr02g0053681 [Helianthus annuus]|nr:hypothetical protein HanOQP8_Chr02g0053681 [Helianthus annuus]
MVKGCMLRMGYNGPLNSANYSKACFPKPYRFFIHSVIHALSHRKDGYDVMRDYQMYMVTALVMNKKYNFSKIIFHYMKENITSGSKTWIYPRFMQMMLDHAYPDLVKDEDNDLLALYHMDNETFIILSIYHKNRPEPKTKAKFFGFIKSANYKDPDPVNHLKWRNDEEMKEKSVADELEKLVEFKNTRNEWFTKEEKERRKEEVRELRKYKQKKKAAGEEGDDEEKSSSDSKVNETERWKKVISDKEKQKKRKRSGAIDDDLYVPSPEHVQEVQTPPSSGGRKKSNARKHVVSPVARKLKIKMKSKPASEPQQPPSELQQPSSPSHQSPPKQLSPQQPPSPPPQQPPSSPPQQQPSSDILQSLQFSPQLRISTPTHKQPVITSPRILQTPPTTQPPVQTTPGSSVFKEFPHIPENIPLEDIGDFNFVTNDVVKKLQKKVEEVLVENKKLEKHVKSVKAENSSLLKKVEADQANIDILKVRIAELEEEKARRDEQNEYFKLKNKELEANNAKKEHEMYMMNKVLENLIKKPVERRFEEIELEEVRARRKAEIEAEMKNKGKGVQVEGMI